MLGRKKCEGFQLDVADVRCRPLFCPRCPIGRCRPFEHASGGVWPPHWHHLLLTLSFLSSLPLMWKPPCLQLCNVQYYLFCERLFKTATQSWCLSPEGYYSSPAQILIPTRPPILSRCPSRQGLYPSP